MVPFSFLSDELHRLPSSEDTEALNKTLSLEEEVKQLRYKIARVSLFNQALWEILRERLDVKDADLERRVREIDLRDGVEDGVVTDTPIRCPRCGRISNSRHWKCLYCGQEFEKPATA
jgi:DNA-directed RNA polymerase subunit RPC12/RpoP